MTKADIQKKVIELVQPGIKPIDIQPSDLPMLLEEMVSEGHIREIEYILPQMDYRTKSFYLPAGTEVTVR